MCRPVPSRPVAPLRQLPGASPLSLPLLREAVQGATASVPLPEVALKIAHAAEALKEAYKLMTEGKFSLALRAFVAILQQVPLMVVDKRAQVQSVRDLVAICREYVTAIRLELARRECKEDAARQAALSCYVTHCKVQPVHHVLFLKVALKTTRAAKNNKTAILLCRRLLDVAMTAQTADVANLIDVAQVGTNCTFFFFFLAVCVLPSSPVVTGPVFNASLLLRFLCACACRCAAPRVRLPRRARSRRWL